MNISKIKNGFNINNVDYLFEQIEKENGMVSHTIISESQLLVSTDKGEIFLDLSCKINNKKYLDLTSFITNLF